MNKSLFLIYVLLTGTHCVASNAGGDIGRDDDVHPSVLTDESDASNWDMPDSTKDEYEDADWHPSPLETIPELLPVSGGRTGDTPTGHSSNHTGSGAAAQCGQYHCRLTATLPSLEGCPDIFRCANDMSFWLQETQARKEHVEELKETVSELQEELMSHQHRLKGLEMQGEERGHNCGQKLRSLELRHAEADTLLRVHAALLQELQARLRNLSAAVRRASRAPPLSILDTLSPGTRDRRHLPPFCPSDCASLYHSGVRRSGVYAVVLSPGASQPVYCDMETDGGGWTVLQRRRDGSVSFNRGWAEYRAGFGEPRGEHWLGNRAVHLLTAQAQSSLRIDLQDWSHSHRHALYHSFRVDSEENRYRLHVSGFSGTLDDSFGWYHDLQGFSTPDTGNICAEISHSGWWFRQCFQTNLNGVYYKGGHYSLKTHNLLGPDGIVWFSWKNSDFYSLKMVTMMVRPHSFRPRVSP